MLYHSMIERYHIINSRERIMSNKKNSIERLKVYLVIVIALIAVLLILPIPVKLLDIIMAMNLAFALAILVMALNAKTKADMPLFPTTVLISTIISLAINISAARIVLVKGADFNGYLICHAGSLMTGFGRINLYAGLAVFITIYLSIILFIAKGATRIAEVAVRFTLDSLPGKQMAIDIAFSTGSISMKEAETKKDNIMKELDFICALDGAGKFFFGNAKAGIIILAAILIGGSAIDHFVRGNTINNAIETYAFLAIGYGLLSIAPVFLVSMAAGIVVAKEAGGKDQIL